MQKLRELLDSWQIEYAVKERKIKREDAERRHSSLLPFGSYELQVHFPETDMDLICVFPSYILQDDFFIKFKSLISTYDEVSHVIDVVDARVPVLKFNY